MNPSIPIPQTQQLSTLLILFNLTTSAYHQLECFEENPSIKSLYLQIPQMYLMGKALKKCNHHELLYLAELIGIP